MEQNQSVKRQKIEVSQEKTKKQLLIGKYNYFPFVKVDRIDVQNGHILLKMSNFDKTILINNNDFVIKDEIVFFKKEGLSATDDSKITETPLSFILPRDLYIESKTIYSKPFYLLKPLNMYGYQQNLDTSTMQPFLCLDEDLFTYFILEIGRKNEYIYVMRTNQSEQEYQTTHDDNTDELETTTPYNIPVELKTDENAKRTVLFSRYQPTRYQKYRHRYLGKLTSINIRCFDIVPCEDDFKNSDGTSFAYTDGSVLETFPGQCYFLFPIEFADKAKEIIVTKNYLKRDGKNVNPDTNDDFGLVPFVENPPNE